MKSVTTIVVFLTLLSGSGVAQCGGSRSKYMGHSQEEAAIRAVLDSQVSAWNRHDLNGFMAGYWNSPDLTFMSGDTVTSGWDGALERYRKAYQAPGKWERFLSRI